MTYQDVLLNYNVVIEAEPGVYEFERTSGMGKTLLYKGAKAGIGAGLPKIVYGYSYNDLIYHVKFSDVKETVINEKYKVLIVDRYDMIRKVMDLEKDFDELAKLGVAVLVDCKKGLKMECGYAHIDMNNKDVISVRCFE